MTAGTNSVMTTNRVTAVQVRIMKTDMNETPARHTTAIMITTIAATATMTILKQITTERADDILPEATQTDMEMTTSKIILMMFSAGMNTITKTAGIPILKEIIIATPAAEIRITTEDLAPVQSATEITVPDRTTIITETIATGTTQVRTPIIPEDGRFRKAATDAA